MFRRCTQYSLSTRLLVYRRSPIFNKAANWTFKHIFFSCPNCFTNWTSENTFRQKKNKKIAKNIAVRCVLLFFYCNACYRDFLTVILQLYNVIWYDKNVCVHWPWKVIAKKRGKLSSVTTSVTLHMVSVRGICFTFFTIIGRRIIGRDTNLHQNVASNSLYIFPQDWKLIIFYQITLDRVFWKSHFLTLCMVSQVASHISMNF